MAVIFHRYAFPHSWSFLKRGAAASSSSSSSSSLVVPPHPCCAVAVMKCFVQFKVIRRRKRNGRNLFGVAAKAGENLFFSMTGIFIVVFPLPSSPHYYFLKMTDELFTLTNKSVFLPSSLISLSPSNCPPPSVHVSILALED